MPGSCRSIHVRERVINSKLGYEQLLARVRRAQPKILGKKAADACEICKRWDTEVGARMEKLIAQPLEILETMLKGYFAKFHSPVSLVGDDGSSVERDCSTYLHTKFEGMMC